MKRRIGIVVALLLIGVMACFTMMACAPVQYTVTVENAEHGKITLSPSAEDGLYDEGTSVTATIAADEGYELDTFTYNGTDKKSSINGNTFVFEVSEDATLKATFKAKEVEPPPPTVEKYTVTINKLEHGSIKLSPTATDNKYEKDTKVTVTVAAETGYEIGTFKVNGEEKKLSANNTYELTVTGNVTLDCTFNQSEVPVETFTVTVKKGNGGDIKFNPEAVNNIYEKGTSVTATVVPEANYEVESFKVNNVETPLTNGNTYVFTVNADITIDVTFKQTAVPVEMYTVKVNQGQNGNVTLTPPAADNRYAKDSKVTVTVAPAAGYEVELFKVNGNDAQLTGGTTYELTVTADTTIDVTFIQKATPVEIFTVTVTKGEGGEVTLTPQKPDNKYEKDDHVTVTVTPNKGYDVGEFKVNNETKALSMTNTYEFDVTADTTINVTFAEVEIETYTVTVDKGEGGDVTLAPVKDGNVYEDGDEVTVTVAPAANYEVDTFLVGGVDKKTELKENVYKFNITDDTEIKVTFKKHAFTVTTNAGNNGKITLAPAASEGNLYDVNTEVTVTVTPDPNFVIDTFTVDTVDKKSELSGANTYVFTVTGDTVIAATFKAAPWTVTTFVEGGTGGGSIALDPNNADGKYENGTQLKITITADATHEIEWISIAGVRTESFEDPKRYETTVNVDKNLDIHAKFKLIQVSVSASVNKMSEDDPMAPGRIAVTDANGKPISDKVDGGSKVTFKVTLDRGYAIDKFMVNGEDKIADVQNNSYVIESIDKDTNVEVYFKVADKVYVYANCLTTGGNGGRASFEPATDENGYVEKGKEMVLTITPVRGYEIAGVTVGHFESASSLTREDITQSIKDNTYSFTADRTYIFDIRFVKIQTFDITVNAGDHGTVSFEPEAMFHEEGTDVYSFAINTQVKMTITPEDRYGVTQLTEKSASAGADVLPTIVTNNMKGNTYTFNVTEGKIFAISYGLVVTENFMGTWKNSATGTHFVVFYETGAIFSNMGKPSGTNQICPIIEYVDDNTITFKNYLSPDSTDVWFTVKLTEDGKMLYIKGASQFATSGEMLYKLNESDALDDMYSNNAELPDIFKNKEFIGDNGDKLTFSDTAITDITIGGKALRSDVEQKKLSILSADAENNKITLTYNDNYNGYWYSAKYENGQVTLTDAAGNSYTLHGKEVTVTASATGEGGKVEVTTEKAYMYQPVTVTVTVNWGYEIESFKVDSEDKLTDVKEGVYTFTPDKESYSIEVTFKKADRTEESVVDAAYIASWKNVKADGSEGEDAEFKLTVENNKITLNSEDYTFVSGNKYDGYTFTKAESSVKIMLLMDIGEGWLLMIKDNKSYVYTSLESATEVALPNEIQNKQYVISDSDVIKNVTFSGSDVTEESTYFTDILVLKVTGDNYFFAYTKDHFYKATWTEDDVKFESIDGYSADDFTLILNKVNAKLNPTGKTEIGPDGNKIEDGAELPTFDKINAVTYKGETYNLDTGYSMSDSRAFFKNESGDKIWFSFTGNGSAVTFVIFSDFKANTDRLFVLEGESAPEITMNESFNGGAWSGNDGAELSVEAGKLTFNKATDLLLISSANDSHFEFFAKIDGTNHYMLGDKNGGSITVKPYANDTATTYTLEDPYDTSSFAASLQGSYQGWSSGAVASTQTATITANDATFTGNIGMTWTINQTHSNLREGYYALDYTSQRYMVLWVVSREDRVIVANMWRSRPADMPKPATAPNNSGIYVPAEYAATHTGENVTIIDDSLKNKTLKGSGTLTISEAGEIKYNGGKVYAMYGDKDTFFVVCSDTVLKFVKTEVETEYDCYNLNSTTPFTSSKYTVSDGVDGGGDEGGLLAKIKGSYVGNYLSQEKTNMTLTIDDSSITLDSSIVGTYNYEASKSDEANGFLVFSGTSTQSSNFVMLWILSETDKVFYATQYKQSAGYDKLPGTLPGQASAKYLFMPQGYATEHLDPTNTIAPELNGYLWSSGGNVSSSKCMRFNADGTMYYGNANTNVSTNQVHFMVGTAERFTCITNVNVWRYTKSGSDYTVIDCAYPSNPATYKQAKSI